MDTDRDFLLPGRFCKNAAWGMLSSVEVLAGTRTVAGYALSSVWCYVIAVNESGGWLALKYSALDPLWMTVLWSMVTLRSFPNLKDPPLASPLDRLDS